MIIRKQPIIALYFERETVLKFYNPEVRYTKRATFDPPAKGHPGGSRMARHWMLAVYIYSFVIFRAGGEECPYQYSSFVIIQGSGPSSPNPLWTRAWPLIRVKSTNPLIN